MKSVLPDKIECRACGQGRPIDEFRVYATDPLLRMDFCMHCEQKDGTITLYRRYNAYGTPEISKAVYAAQRVPAAKRKPEQVRLLVEPKAVKTVESKEDVAQLELARRELCRRRFMYYVTTFDPAYNPGWVHQDVARRIELFMERVERRESPRMMLFMPPRIGKSREVSDMAPSWMLGHHPEWEIIAASYGIDLPVGFSRNIRDRMRDPEHQAIFEDARLRTDSQSVESWKTTKGGGYTAAGVGVGITGKGFNVGICDDLIKDYEASQSETIRENTWSWYQSVFRTRAAPGAGIILIMCLTGDTAVTMADGSYKPLADVRVGDSVAAYENGRRVARTVLNQVSQGEDEVFNVRTGHSSVRANARHPFLVKRGDQVVWVKTSELKKGDLLVTSALRTEGSSAALSELEAWLLGYMFGDGWVTTRNAKNYDKARDTHYPRRGYVTCVALSQHGRLNDELLGVFHSVTGVKPKPTKYGYARTDVAKVGRWFIERGLVGKAKTKRLPNYIFSESLDNRLAFLNGFNAADGAIVSKGPNKGRWVHCLCNEALVRDVRHLARESGYNVTNVCVSRGTAQASNSPTPTQYTNVQVQWSPKLASAEFVTSAVRTVESVGRAEVFDIQVEGAESFIADGLVVHNTRWHDADVAGKALKVEAQLRKAGVPEWELENWDVVSYPALAVQDEYLMPDGSIHRGDLVEGDDKPVRLLRRADEPLHPERYPKNEVMKIKHTTAKPIWQAMYQQNPTPDDGDFFKKSDIRYRVLQPDYIPLAKIFITTDYAISKATRRNWTVSGVWALTSNDDLYLLEARRGRWGSLEIIKNEVELILKWRPAFYAGERGQIHASVWPMIEAALNKERVYISVDETLVPMQDKDLRARPLQGRMQAGKLFLSHTTTTKSDVIDAIEHELLRFPNGADDDCVDMCAWAARLALVLPLPEEAQAPKQKGWEDELLALVGNASNESHMAA